MLFRSKNIKDAIGFDLGGKTSDCTVITNGKPNIMASNSIMRGYDNVLQRSVDYLQSHQQKALLLNLPL